MTFRHFTAEDEQRARAAYPGHIVYELVTQRGPVLMVAPLTDANRDREFKSLPGSGLTLDMLDGATIETAEVVKA